MTALREIVVDEAKEHTNGHGEVKSWKVRIGDKETYFPMSTCTLVKPDPLTFTVPVFLHKRITAAA